MLHIIQLVFQYRREPLNVNVSVPAELLLSLSLSLLPKWFKCFPHCPDKRYVARGVAETDRFTRDSAVRVNRTTCFVMPIRLRTDVIRD